MKSLCIIPIFNQVKELPKLLKLCTQFVPSSDVLLVDDGSDDRSEFIIRHSGLNFVRIEERRGVGHALIVGTRFAVQNNFDVVVHMAGNGKMLPSEMSRLLEPLIRNEADYVWGSRYLPGGRFVNAPKFRQYGIKYVFNLIPLILFGKVISDATCGFRAYRLKIFDQMGLQWDHPWLYQYEFEYYVLANVLLQNVPRLEVPISMVYPQSGKNYSKIIPFISWWSMLKPWLFVRLGIDPGKMSLSEVSQDVSMPS